MSGQKIMAQAVHGRRAMVKFLLLKRDSGAKVASVVPVDELPEMVEAAAKEEIGPPDGNVILQVS